MMHSKMNEDVKHSLIKNYISREDNIFHAEKMFMVFSVLRWIEEQKTNIEVKAKYFNHIDKFLSNEIDLYWEDGIIKYKSIKNDNRGKK